MNIVNIILCVVLAIAAVIVLFKKKTFKDAVLSLRTEIIILSVIGVIAIAVRVWQFGAVPGGFNQDGAMAAVDAFALSQHGTDRFGMPLPVHFTAWGYGQMSVLLSYAMVPFIKLFGLNPVTARLPMLIVSLIGLAVLYLLVRDIFGKKQAFIVLAVTAINPWHIMQSRWALDCNMLPHFLLFSIYFFHLGHKRKLYLYISMVFFGLTMYTYGIAFYAVPLLLIALAVYLIVKKAVKLWQAGICVLIYAAVSWPIFAVMIINYFELETIRFLGFTIPYFPHSVRANDLVIFSPDIFGQLVLNVKSFVNVVLLQKPGLPWNSIPQFGAMYLFAMPLVALGAIHYAKDYKDNDKHTGKFAVIAWGAVSLLTALMVNGININRINIIFYPLCILCGLGIYALITSFKKVVPVLCAVAVVFVVAFSAFTVSYFKEHNKVLSRNFFSGFGEALGAAEETNADTIYITNYTQFENSFHVSEILTLFHSDIDAQYYMGTAPAYDDEGNELLVFNQRYRFTDFGQPFDIQADAVYVINLAEYQRFDAESFNLEVYDGYALATPNK